MSDKDEKKNRLIPGHINNDRVTFFKKKKERKKKSSAVQSLHISQHDEGKVKTRNVVKKDSHRFQIQMI